jgi:hypothetical protein
VKWGCQTASDRKVFWVCQFFKNGKVLMFFSPINNFKPLETTQKKWWFFGGTFGGTFAVYSPLQEPFF